MCNIGCYRLSYTTVGWLCLKYSECKNTVQSSLMCSKRNAFLWGRVHSYSNANILTWLRVTTVLQALNAWKQQRLSGLQTLLLSCWSRTIAMGTEVRQRAEPPGSSISWQPVVSCIISHFTPKQHLCFCTDVHSNREVRENLPCPRYIQSKRAQRCMWLKTFFTADILTSQSRRSTCEAHFVANTERDGTRVLQLVQPLQMQSFKFYEISLWFSLCKPKSPMSGSVSQHILFNRSSAVQRCGLFWLSKASQQISCLYYFLILGTTYVP